MMDRLRIFQLLLAGVFFCALALGLRAGEEPAREASPGAVGPTNSAPAAASTNRASTNAEPHFRVDQYLVTGNTLIPTNVIDSILSHHTGTNITFDDIITTLKDLTLEYRRRGYDTVSVTIPRQKLTNGVFRLRVFEGRLAEILVKGNHWFSSNNIMRALPSLRTNIYLNSKYFQAELDRANANQDRQIYPEIHEGPEPDTSSLWLVVKDRIAFHTLIEANNQSPPGTPEERLNSSIAYNNLWQLNHSMGFQYAFSEQDFKDSARWNFYDQPLVANYSGYYRLPIGAPTSVSELSAANPVAFGYNEATRKFQLPAATSAPELNLYASRSTMDSGINAGPLKSLFTSTARDIDQQTLSQDLTINEDVGWRYSQPLPAFWGFTSHAQAGFDLKWYSIASFATNDFIITQFLHDVNGNPFTRVSVTPSPVPATMKAMTYLPLNLRWDAHREDPYGSVDVGFGYSPNVYYSGGRENVESIAGSAKATGYWQILTASAERDQTLYGDWKLALKADGQWASEPLISNEQFGIGGIAGVRGYREGEIYGDNGWRVTSEVRTPTHRIGFAGLGTTWPLSVRASVFMDYAQADLIDPQGRKAITPLWGAGIGGAATMGSVFSARLAMTWPLLSTPYSEAGQLRLMFALTAQF